MLKFYCYHFTGEKQTEQIIEEIRMLCEQTKQYEREEEIMLFVFVPTVSLEAVCAAIPERKLVKISAQSFSVKEISSELTPDRLKEIGADMAITGLADRRYFLGETSEMCRDNLEILLNLGFKGMLCVGETKEMADDGTAGAVLSEQVRIGYGKIPYEAHYRIGTIYRPLWEFDRSFAPEEGYTREMLGVIREAARKALPGFPIEMPLFYGGPLSSEKVEEYLKEGLIDGVFTDSRDCSVEEFVTLIGTVKA